MRRYNIEIPEVTRAALLLMPFAAALVTGCSGGPGARDPLDLVLPDSLVAVVSDMDAYAAGVPPDEYQDDMDED